VRAVGLALLLVIPRDSGRPGPEESAIAVDPSSAGLISLLGMTNEFETKEMRA